MPTLIQWVIISLLTPLLCNTSAPPPSGCTAIKPSPSGLVCGQRGPFDVYPYGGTPNSHSFAWGAAGAKTLQQCRDLCGNQHLNAEDVLSSQDSRCGSFGFDEAQELCQLHQAGRPSKHFKPNNSSPLVVYDIDCFDCPACSKTPGAQLLENGGFELSNKYFGPWEIRMGEQSSSLAQPGLNSSTAYRCLVTAESNRHGCWLIHSFQRCTQGYYFMSFSYFVNPGQGTNFSISASFANGLNFNENVVRGPVEATGSWKTVGHIRQFNQISENTVQLYVQNPTNSNGPNDCYPCYGDILFDNIQVSALPLDLPVSPGTAELLKNGGFERGSVTPWKITTDVTAHPASLVSPGLKGSKHALFWEYSNYHDIRLEQSIATKPGTLYKLSFQYLRLQATNPAQTSFGLFISSGDVYDPNNSTLQAIDSPTKNRVVSVEHPFYASGETTNVMVLFAYSYARGRGNITFDNFSIMELAPFS